MSEPDWSALGLKPDGRSRGDAQRLSRTERGVTLTVFRGTTARAVWLDVFSADLPNGWRLTSHQYHRRFATEAEAWQCCADLLALAGALEPRETVA